ncbi:hypothetical protein GGF46_000484 [Coemansia sp. RSA 552]|nr:hypothetical protein GGF46_000484 [Coemansia sp. RSA 552]
MKTSCLLLATALLAATASAADPRVLENRQLGILQAGPSPDDDDSPNLIDDIILNQGDVDADADADETDSAQDDTILSAPPNDDEDDDDTDDDEKDAPSTSNTDAGTSSTKDADTKTDSSSEAPTSEGTDSDADDDDSDAPTKSESKTSETESSSSKPSPTGSPCSNDGEKRCASSGNGFQVCEDGVWSDQTCSGSDVCKKDDDGEIACVDKDQATVKQEKCSKKEEQRCDASDKNKYQVCDGKHWQNFGCDNNQDCNMNDDKVICGDLEDGGELASYTMHEPTAFVPESAAPAIRAVMAVVALAAAAAFVL